MKNVGPIFSAMLRNKSSMVLMVLQVALTLAIVSNAAFIIQERIELMQRDTGYNEETLFSFSVYSFDESIDLEQQNELDEDMLRAIPGVNNAVAINQIPLSGSGDSTQYRNQLEKEGALYVQGGLFKGDEQMLNTLGITVSEGRDFTTDDVVYTANGDMVSTAIVTRSFANKLFPDGDALGKNMFVFDKGVKIIGIIENVLGPWVHWHIFNDNVFIPQVDPRSFKRYAVNADPSEMNTIMLSIQERMSKLHKGRVVNEPVTLIESKDGSYSADRLMINMLVIIISVLLFITAIGIAGMAIFNVNRRRRQIGTRRALGASQGQILNHFMTENFIMTALGIVIGSVLTIVLNGYLMEYFSSSKIDLSYIIYTIVGLVALGQMAVFMPAKKAASTSPAVATRAI